MKDLKQLIKDKKIFKAKTLILSNLDSIEESIDIVLKEIEIEPHISIGGQIIKDMPENFGFPAEGGYVAPSEIPDGISYHYSPIRKIIESINFDTKA